jgi:hypothetical protein
MTYSACMKHIWFDMSSYGYKCIGFNRTQIHINAPKGSWGIALLIKNNLYELYNIKIVD